MGSVMDQERPWEAEERRRAEREQEQHNAEVHEIDVQLKAVRRELDARFAHPETSRLIEKLIDLKLRQRGR